MSCLPPSPRNWPLVHHASRFLLSGLSVLMLALISSLNPLGAGDVTQPSLLKIIRIQETAGLRRFGYPVTARVELESPLPANHDLLRLVDRQGKQVPAQWTFVREHQDKFARTIELDFPISLGPLETIDLRLEYVDPNAKAERLEIKEGLTFTDRGEFFQVAGYDIQKSAHPLVSRIEYDRSYVAPAGLQMSALANDKKMSLAAGSQPEWTVEKSGPYAVRLRADGVYTEETAERDLPFRWTLNFCASKSWIGLRHEVFQVPASRRITLVWNADLSLKPPILWDADCGYWLYGTLELQQQMHLRQTTDDWICRSGLPEQQAIYAARSATGPRFRGWGHFQESRTNGNVVAFGVAEESAGDQEWLFRGNGQMELRWTATMPHKCSQELMLHFIPVPAQITALTSPTAMMKPLQVSVLDREP